MEENLPAQTIIGTFNTLDPDDWNGTRNYKYELINIQTGTGATVLAHRMGFAYRDRF